jgi:hypothetical protein
VKWRVLALLALGASGCGDGGSGDDAPVWQVVAPHLDAALLSVWGTSASDVWTVGGDAGAGPLVLHHDGASWQQLDTGQRGDLWWAFGFADGPLYLGGVGGMILRWQDGAFERMPTPGTGTVFGIWGATPDELWAVGGAPGGARGAFAWRLTSGSASWQEVPGFPAELAERDALWKVSGHGASDVWLVGTGGKLLHWDGAQLTASFAGIAESLFTVHANSTRFAAVGGFASGLLLERGVEEPASAPWTDRSPPGAQALVGVCLTERGGYAVGQFGYVARRDEQGWREDVTGLPPDPDNRSLHSVWVDPDGGVWAVGGQVLVEPLIDGWLLHRGGNIDSAGLPLRSD